MSVFDLLAETRYKRWLELNAQEGYVAPPPVETTASRKSYESVLLNDIRSILSKAAVANSADSRAELLRLSADLEFQLIVLLERQGLPLVAQTLRGVIKRDRDRVTSIEGSR